MAEQSHPAIPSQASPPAPFIVTAELPPDVLAWADRLRQAHFPPERNWLKAHVTLFHNLAPSLGTELKGLLAGLAQRTSPPHCAVTGLMNLGRGTAIALASPGMSELRASLSEHFWTHLTAQDQHKARLHITVQNKVSAEAARALQSALADQLAFTQFYFRGLGLHIYRNPYWETVQTWSFRGKEGG